MKNKQKLILISIISIIVIILIFYLQWIAKQIPKNPVNTIGNTASNLYNKGLFCEDDGIVYFSNSYDNGTLYSMNSDETNVKQISSLKINSINAAGNYLYFYVNDSSTGTGLGYVRKVVGIYRSKKSGKAITTLKREPALTIALYENSLYYQNYNSSTNTTLNKINLNGTNDTILSNQPINPASIHNGIIYYTDTTTTNFLCQFNLQTLSNSVLIKYNMYQPILEGNYIYFIDISEGYRLCRYSLSNETIEVITNDRIDAYNIIGTSIYYQKNSTEAPAFKRISIDGSNELILLEGNYTNINATSNYVYFQPFHDLGITYKVPTSGSPIISEFTAAIPNY